MDLTNLNKDSKKRRKSNIDLTTMVYGKVPPQAKQVEEVVLGAIMLERGAFDIASEILRPEMFYLDAHQRVFKAMRTLAQKSQPIDELTVVQELLRMENLELVGGPYYITQLTSKVTSGAHIESHARIILEKYMKREILRIGAEMTTDAYEDSSDVFDLLDSAETNLIGLTVNNLKKDFQHIDVGLVKVFKEIDELSQRDSSLTGVPSGFTKLDQCTGGWQKTDLIIIAARPSVGKTAFALNLARNAALHPEFPSPVAVFSLEMSTHQLTQRMLSAQSDIYLERIRKGKLDEEQKRHLYSHGMQALAQAPIYIDDTPALSIFELRAKVRRLKSKHNIGLVIIDYLQLMTADIEDRRNREQEISKISRELKKTAKELEIPIIALSQLSREVEKRANRSPVLADLRESGAIEQDADMVVFIWKPDDKDIQKDPTIKDMGYIKISKHRNGTLEDFVMKFKGWVQRWEEIQEAPIQGSWVPIDQIKSTPHNEPQKKSVDGKEDLPF
jgi:replicative DNA helicase